uniref:ATP synthase subunit a n=1 Tax=Cleroidea sp. 2 KM-2017 TaxID=2219307 RepID=A0A346RH16_9CUCU|nr:ATP synthase F0 subunit 6 [Cleroidea sp. 2 KM-2017]
MMINLFSSFDPITSFGFSLNWLSTIICLITIPSMFWLIPSRLNLLWIKISNTLHMEFKTLLGNQIKGSTLIFVSLFSLILFNNFLGLFPYIFTSTSHMVLTLTLALPLWFSLMLIGWINNTMHMFTHLVPQGTPPLLMPFMVCIETISNLIRPGALAVRLSANMIAGHLLLTLLGNIGPMISTYMLSALIVVQLLLLVLESAVAVIQAYVFAILSTLYFKEIY